MLRACRSEICCKDLWRVKAKRWSFFPRSGFFIVLSRARYFLFVVIMPRFARIKLWQAPQGTGYLLCLVLKIKNPVSSVCYFPSHRPGRLQTFLRLRNTRKYVYWLLYCETLRLLIFQMCWPTSLQMAWFIPITYDSVDVSLLSFLWCVCVCVYIYIYLLTPWSRVLLEKLTGSASSQEIPRIFGTRRFITVLTRARHLSLSWANSIQSSQPRPTSWRSILILTFHLRLGLPSGLFPCIYIYIHITKIIYVYI